MIHHLNGIQRLTAGIGRCMQPLVSKGKSAMPYCIYKLTYNSKPVTFTTFNKDTEGVLNDALKRIITLPADQSEVVTNLRNIEFEILETITGADETLIDTALATIGTFEQLIYGDDNIITDDVDDPEGFIGKLIALLRQRLSPSYLMLSEDKRREHHVKIAEAVAEYYTLTFRMAPAINPLDDVVKTVTSLQGQSETTIHNFLLERFFDYDVKVIDNVEIDPKLSNIDVSFSIVGSNKLKFSVSPDFVKRHADNLMEAIAAFYGNG